MAYQDNSISALNNPQDLSEMGAMPVGYKFPPTGGVPANWLPSTTTSRSGQKTPQGAVYNPKLGYTPSNTTSGGFRNLNLNTGAAMGPIPAAIGTLATLLQKGGAGLGTMPTFPKVGGTPSPTLPVQTTTAPPTSAITPIQTDPYGSAMVDGNRINYSDIGNPLKDVALINSKGYSFATAPAEATTTQTAGGTNLGDILKTIQSVAPVQDYASRVGALNTGNTTWDMDPLAKIMAAKAGQQADTERYQQQTGALANLGSAQMNADAAKYGHQATLAGKREEISAMAPYYAGQTQKNVAQAEAAPLAAKADVLKALTEQAKNNPVLKTTLDIMAGLAERGDVVGYNAYAAKVAALTGKLIPPMQAQD